MFDLRFLFESWDSSRTSYDGTILHQKFEEFAGRLR